MRPGDYVTFRYRPRTVPSTPFTDQASKDLEKIKAHGIEQAKKRFRRLERGRLRSGRERPRVDEVAVARAVHPLGEGA